VAAAARARAAEFGRLNSAHETPVLELEDGTTLTQSNAILWYLSEEAAYLPTSNLERAQATQWLVFKQERVMSGIGSARFRTLTGRDPELISARFPELARIRRHREPPPSLEARAATTSLT
jgi:glutathione S-transferase